MDSVKENEGNKSSPPETVTDPGSTLACSAATGPGGKTSGRKRKTEVGRTPPKTKKKKTKRGPSLGTTVKEAEPAWSCSCTTFRAFRLMKCDNNS